MTFRGESEDRLERDDKNSAFCFGEHESFDRAEVLHDIRARSVFTVRS